MPLKYKLKLLVLLGVDLVLMLLAFYGAFLIRFGVSDAKGVHLMKHPAELLLFVAILLINSYIFDVYNLDKHRSRKQILANITIAVAMDFFMLAGIFYLYPPVMVGRGVLAILLLLFFVMQFLWHITYVYLVQHPMLAETSLILGTGALAKKLGELISESSLRFYNRLVGYVECDEDRESAQVPAESVVGEARDLQGIALRERVTKIIVALPDQRKMDHIRQLLLTCKFHGVEIVDGLAFYEQTTGKLLLTNVNIADELIYSSTYKSLAIMAFLKRLIDLCLAFCCLLLALPFTPIIALLVKLDSPGPLFYRQMRIGQWGKVFTLYKFRTMQQDIEAASGAVWAQENDPRIGAIGKFLRKWRIDELPQCFNVLKGEMSFIGPRPERPEFVEKLAAVIPCYAYRHFVNPGITGWAQIKYSYGASVEQSYEKLCYDLYYIKHASPSLDLLIIFETFKVVIFGRGR